jgi:hypothetical protein
VFEVSLKLKKNTQKILVIALESKPKKVEKIYCAK